MTTDVPTSTQVEATRVRQAARIIRNTSDLRVANPSSSSGSGQHKRVRFADLQRPDPKTRTRHGDADWQSGGT